ncbi:MAG: phosphoribosylglycinamide formyltransferase [Lentisphaerae bacterium RIFOXYA12_FULL_48_11]|nr:MAG: phosphoribosylglycinamide formyltransferase [Lentisphaerae bacterium RIFOXYA12_FULL_48_11]
MQPLKVAILGSGKGSNCQSIIDAIKAGTLNARIVCVISDVENALILDRAKKNNIPAEYLSAAPFKTKLDGEAERNYLAVLRKYGAEIIVLAGFMRIIKKNLLQAFAGRILNIHPALLPAFPGVESWKQAMDYGAKVAGCTVHIVDEGTDTGPILVQKAVPILENDTAEILHARIQAEEHKAYPEALRFFSENRISMEGRRVKIKMD